MSRKVFCKKYQKDMDGLSMPPLPGAKGQDIYNNISQQAWSDWLKHQTMLINEKHLNLMDKDNRKYLSDQMDKFFAGDSVDEAEGYVPPEPNKPE